MPPASSPGGSPIPSDSEPPSPVGLRHPAGGAQHMSYTYYRQVSPLPWAGLCQLVLAAHGVQLGLMRIKLMDMGPPLAGGEPSRHT